MTEDARGIFAADMAANLLAVFLLILALLPYAEPDAAAPPPTTAPTVTSGRAFVDALHRHATEGPDRGTSIAIGREPDLAAACRRAPGPEAVTLIVMDVALLPTLSRSPCPELAGARLLIVPASLKGPDGSWSPAVRRLFAAPGTPEAFRRDLLALLQGGIADVEPPSSGPLATLRRLGDEMRRWGDFITAAAMLIFLRRFRNAREQGAP